MIRVDFSRLRFLVIDDNAHMRRIVRTLLHGFGAATILTASKGEAQDLAQEFISRFKYLRGW